jgi:hypothetical protein
MYTYIGILLGAHYILNIRRIRVNIDTSAVCSEIQTKRPLVCRTLECSMLKQLTRIESTELLTVENFTEYHQDISIVEHKVG